jgi:hypothetical protein
VSDRKRPSLGAPRTEGRPEVELYERVYTLVPVTRSVQKKLQDAEQAINRAQDGDSAVAAVAAGCDVMMQPVNGQRTPASKLIKEHWEAEKLALDELMQFFEDVQAAAARPT